MSYLFKYYSKQYDRFMKIFKLDKSDEIIKVLGNIYNKKIVDIGGGTGTLAKNLIALGGIVTIVDPEKSMTDLARNKSEKINILNEYSDSISLKDNSIDIIVMRDAFHHILKKKETFEECKRVLKSGGRIVICEFNKSHIISKVIAMFEFSCFEKIEMINKDEIKELGKSYFKKEEIIDISAFEFIYFAEKA